ncbi:MAG: sigma-54-dependent Fis family transcriptional regulator [Deltaproteobacteria bacterium]|nr:sigma-54-dependent Fis family transcriptional regulator [Deltaproteobacteria bacterium]
MSLSPADADIMRPARVRFSITIGDRTFEGATRSLGRTAIHAVLRPALPVELATPGRSARFRLELPDAGIVDGPTELSWVDPSELDADGHPSTGLGLSINLGDARGGEALASFLSSFRYLVLVAVDDDRARARIEESLAIDFAIVRARSVDEIESVLERKEVSVLLLGPSLAGVAPLEVLERINRRSPKVHAARVVLSGGVSVDELRALVNRGGILRSLTIDVEADELRAVVMEAAERYAIDVESERTARELARTKRWLERENAFLRQRLTGVEGFDKIIGSSPKLREVLRRLERIRRTDAPVHVHGETGTGKELVARALHAGGPRSERPYIVQNCAGLTESLLQSTLFGHRKGAFTSADRDHRGVFLEADGGTLFLDEVGELSPATQAMLLRALQEGEVTPVGASRPIKVDVRVISATHRALRDDVRAGRFREDLFYRLIVVSVELPALRERHGDVPLLARHFLATHCEDYERNIPGFKPETMAALEAYSWPGNVRELDNEVERMVILAEDGDRIGTELLPPHIFTQRRPEVPAIADHPAGADLEMLVAGSYDDALERLEHRLVTEALRESNGSITRAAERLGIERSRFGKIKKRLGLP